MHCYLLNLILGYYLSKFSRINANNISHPIHGASRQKRFWEDVSDWWYGETTTQTPDNCVDNQTDNCYGAQTGASCVPCDTCQDVENAYAIANWGLDKTTIPECYVCLCQDGLGKTGLDCPSDGDYKCASCNGGYYLDNDLCVPYPTTTVSALATEPQILSNPRFGDGSYYWEHRPEYAIDGDRTPTGDSADFFAHSLTDQNPTFIVDLPSSQTIVGKVVIYPRQDGQFGRYSQMKIRVDNNYCETSQSLDAIAIEANKETGIIFQCNNVSGSVITVENGNYHLQIAEIEAFRPSTVTSTMTATTTERQGNGRNPPRYSK